MEKLVLSFLLLMLVHCEPEDTDNCHYGINFINKTDKVLFVLPSKDTILHNYMDPREDSFQASISPYAGQGGVPEGRLRFLASVSPRCVENLLRYDPRLYVFVFDSLTLGNKDWEEVMTNYLVAKRYNLTLNDLEQMDWIITFDGN